MSVMTSNTAVVKLIVTVNQLRVPQIPQADPNCWTSVRAGVANFLLQVEIILFRLVVVRTDRILNTGKLPRHVAVVLKRPIHEPKHLGMGCLSPKSALRVSRALGGRPKLNCAGVHP